MANEDERKRNSSSDETLPPRETTMKSVASSLAVMFIEDNLQKGKELSFPSLDVKITKQDLLGPNRTGNGNGKSRSDEP